MRGRRRWLAVAGLVLGLVGVNLVTAGPAVASIPGLTRVSASAVGANLPVSVTVTCPFSDYRVYGLGGEIVGGNGQVHMVSLLPNAALTAVTVIAAPRVPGPLAPWQVTAYAICGRPWPGLHLEVAPAPAVVDVEPCDGATRLYGTGARQTGHPAGTLHEMVPNAPAFPPIFARASVAGGAPSVAAAAICAAPLATLNSIVAPAAAVGSTVMCPAGQLVHGTGGFIPAANPGIVFEGIVPNAALTQVRVTARDGGGVAQPTRAFAVCA